MSPRRRGPVAWNAGARLPAGLWPLGVGDRAVLIAVRRIGDRLSIAVRDGKHEHVALLRPWTEPPSIEEVQAWLSRMIGRTIREAKDADLPPASRDEHGF